MLRALQTRLGDLERRMRRAFGNRIDTPVQRALAHVQFHLFDHAFLRGIWTNWWRVDDGVWRANQPSPRRLRAWKRRGIRTVLNLRGEAEASHYLFEREACEALGLVLVDIPMSSRHLPTRRDLERYVAVFREAERPLVMHCKSGADRTGFMSALWLVAMRGAPVRVARRQLHWRFVHLSRGETGILDHFFDVYEHEGEARGIPFMRWVREHYDSEALTREYRRSGRRGPLRGAGR